MDLKADDLVPATVATQAFHLHIQCQNLGSTWKTVFNTQALSTLCSSPVKGCTE